MSNFTNYIKKIKHECESANTVENVFLVLDVCLSFAV